MLSWMVEIKSRSKRRWFPGITPLIIVISGFLIPWSEQGSLFGGSGTQLYSPEDQVFVLNSTNIEEHIYGSNRAWVVEFYSSWCGHCIHFAPKWKQFALEVSPWQNILVIAGIDCADESNVAICRDYEIMGYPSLRFFPPHSANKKKIVKEGILNEELYRGEISERSENLGDMKRGIIDQVIPYVHNYHSPNTKSPISNFNELWDYIAKHTKPPEDLPSFVLLIFEKKSSHLVKEVALTLSKFPSVAVFGFTNKTPLYSELQLDGWPAFGYAKKDHISGKIMLEKNQNIPLFIVKKFVEIAQLPMDDLTSTINLRQKIMSEVKVVNEDPISNNLEEPRTSSSQVSLEDLIHAVRNSLRNEVGLLKKITGTQLQSLKNYVHALAEFFPADRSELVLFLIKLSTWLGPMEQIDDVIYMDKLSELEMELHPWDIEVNAWGNCKGSVPGRRGYSCSLWTLFHTLTVIAYEKNQNFPVLDAIHGYAKDFFGCKDCSGHFTKMVAEDGALMISPIKDQVIWLWKAHNKVNLRLKGSLSEDPAYPKIQYPGETQCSECYGKENIFDEEKVLQHLIKVYSKPERTLQPVKPATERIYSNGNARPMNPGFFSGIDYWLFCIVYLSVAILLVLAYVHFRVKRGRFDISYLFCRREKHLYTGKNNV